MRPWSEDWREVNRVAGSLEAEVETGPVEDTAEDEEVPGKPVTRPVIARVRSSASLAAVSCN